MSQSTEEEKQKYKYFHTFIHSTTCFFFYRRHVAMQDGLKEAVNVPLNLMRTAHKCWPHLHSLAEHGNIQTMSDLQVMMIIARCMCVCLYLIFLNNAHRFLLVV